MWNAGDEIDVSDACPMIVYILGMCTILQLVYSHLFIFSLDCCENKRESCPAPFSASPMFEFREHDSRKGAILQHSLRQWRKIKFTLLG